MEDYKVEDLSEDQLKNFYITKIKSYMQRLGVQHVSSELYNKTVDDLKQLREELRKKLDARWDVC